MHPRPATGVSDRSAADLKLEGSFNAWDERSNNFQKRRLSFVKWAIVVGPIAVLLLAIQVIAVPHGGWAAVLIAIEALLLGIAVCIPFLKLGRSHNLWISARVRAEVLRRERSLLFAQVGPYLDRTPTDREEEVLKRLVELSKDLTEGNELLSSTQAPTSWRNDLENAAASQHSNHARDLPDVRQLASAYLQNRVSEQQDWFIKTSKDHEHRSERLENRARLVLTVALVLAAIHLGTLLWQWLTHAPKPDCNDHRAWEQVLAIAALSLPAVGAALIAYRSALGSQRQALSYKYYAKVMVPLHSQLQTLAGGSQLHPDDSLKFKRLVLDVEEVLSDELRQWWMNMVIKEPHTTA